MAESRFGCVMRLVKLVFGGSADPMREDADRPGGYEPCYCRVLAALGNLIYPKPTR